MSDIPLHIDILRWLRTIGLNCDEYRMIFGRFMGVESLLHLTEQDLYDLGIENGAHRAKIITSLIVIKAQLERRLGLKTSKSAHELGSLQTGNNPEEYEPPDYAQLNVSTSPAAETMAMVRSPSFNIDNHPWYHCNLSRKTAELLVKNEGDFLVRNSISNPGDYVLTCRWKGQSLHFMVNKQVETTGKYTKLKYQFEDALFDSVPGLVNFYVTCKCAISQQSGAIITNPIRRGDVPRADIAKRPLPAPPEITVDRTESMPATPRSKTFHSSNLVPPDYSKMQRSESDSKLRPESHLHRTSPQRILKKSKPTVELRNKSLYEDDGKDYSDYDQVKATPTIILEARRRRAEGLTSPLTSPLLPQFPTSPNNDGYGKLVSQQEVFRAINKTGNMKLPDIDAKTVINPNEFSTSILDRDNKPLDTKAIIAVKTVLLNNTPAELARHLTKIDIDLLKVLGEDDLGVCINSGLEFITLPQGDQMRQDVLERCSCLRMFIVLTILTCPQLNERAKMLQQWIEIAAEVKQKMGNLMSFAVIVESLAHPAITRLRQTWLQVHQQFSQTLYTLKNKLRPFLQSLHDGTAQLPLQNISIPYIMPVISLLERRYDDQDILSWEVDDINGLDTMLLHLDTARVITAQCSMYRMKAEEIVDHFNPDSDILDVFRTELHLRLCWGARGVNVTKKDRLDKFNQLLTVLSQKSEQSENSESSV